MRADHPPAYAATVAPRAVQLTVADLPTPVSMDGGLARVTPRAVEIDRVGVALLDASARLSATVSMPAAQEIRGSVADGKAGEQAIAWLWQRAQLPSRLEPATPLIFAARHVRWTRNESAEAVFSAQPGAGPKLDADLRWRPEALEVKRLAIKDQASDAVLGITARGRQLEGRFSGTLVGRSVAALFRGASGEHPGQLTGDFRATLDRERIERITLQGRLTGTNLQIGLLLPVPLELQRIELDADGASVRVRQATFAWAGQEATVRGEAALTDTGPVIKAQLDSPGIVLDALLPAKSGEPTEPPASTARMPESLKFWPLPMRGTLSANLGYLEARGLRVQPVQAKLELEPERVRLDVTDAALCGVAFPFLLEAAPQGFDVTARISAKEQQLEDVVQCFTDQRVLITGRFDLSAQLAAKGTLEELIEKMDGPVQFAAREGEIRKFAMLGNILALKDITGSIKKGLGLGSEGFGYRKLSFQGRFGGGLFSVEQASLDSSALGLAATGTIRLADRHADLTVLVAPFSRIDRLVRKLPVLGYILGGAITSLPVGVSGDIQDPTVVPLGAKAMSSELLGIFERTFQLPGKMLEPLTTAQPSAP
jgi:hypothetical protein